MSISKLQLEINAYRKKCFTEHSKVHPKINILKTGHTYFRLVQRCVKGGI